MCIRCALLNGRRGEKGGGGRAWSFLLRTTTERLEWGLISLRGSALSRAVPVCVRLMVARDQKQSILHYQSLRHCNASDLRSCDFLASRLAGQQVISDQSACGTGFMSCISHGAIIQGRIQIWAYLACLQTIRLG